VTRKYAHQLDAIIRVQFVDEGDRLHVSEPSRSHNSHQILDYTKEADKLSPEVGLMARVRRALQHGVIVAGQRFYPVASSSSQQK
jgi:RNA-dependent RNA polymerase